MSSVKKFDIQELSHSDRILLAEQLWDSVAENQDSLEITASQKKVLEERLAAYRISPNAGSSWEDVKNEMK
ncbi:MAG: putative addiction module component (TIGR02574 family) [Gammaproteobacteria bacterium]|jgi:putative addiction module component (TIGR02574 family)